MKTYLEMDEILRHSHTYIGKGYYDDFYRDLVSAVPEEVIRSLPPADVVDVVRCADCKYDERCMFQDFVRDERVVPYDKTEFFCSDGKRKDGGQKNV